MIVSCMCTVMLYVLICTQINVIYMHYILLPSYMYSHICTVHVYIQAVPDTKLTLKKYSYTKFEFLVRIHVHVITLKTLLFFISPSFPQAYCLKVKEMDDEEYEAAVSYITLQISSIRCLTWYT